jgi:hypothetical protein
MYARLNPSAAEAIDIVTTASLSSDLTQRRKKWSSSSLPFASRMRPVLILMSSWYRFVKDPMEVIWSESLLRESIHKGER